MTTITDYWHDLVTVSLLGTDRREPPAAPTGPLADVVADVVRSTPSARMLAGVAACTAARRGGIAPHAPAMPLAGPPPDPRPMLPEGAARRWRIIASRWPVLEDEWLDIVGRRGWRLSPDVVVGLLARHRSDGARRTKVHLVAGPLADWLVEHQPQLATPSSRRRTTQIVAGDLPALAVAPELLPFLTAGPDAVSRIVVDGFAGGAWAISHRGVLVNFVARARTDVLESLATALLGIDPAVPTVGLAHTLAEVAQLRHDMRQELEVRR